MVSTKLRTLATMVDFAQRLAAAMAHAKVDAKDLRDHLKISYQAVKKLETGLSKSLTAENCARAARYLKVDWFWLATGEGQMLDVAQARASNGAAVAADVGCSSEAAPAAVEWPFRIVGYRRLLDLQRALGTKRGHEAIRDIDKHLEIVVLKWEREAEHADKSHAA